MSSRYGWIANNFFHDLSSGLWAACLIVIWRLASYLGPIALPSAAEALRGVSHELFGVLLVSLVVIMATGGVRLRYWRTQRVADEIPYLQRALLVKHGLFLVVYGFGTAWAWALQR
jgi:putative copper export protein